MNLDPNRRIESRVRTPRIPVRITSEASFREDYVHDLSRGGLFILSEELLSIGTEVEIDLFPPGWAEPLALRGQVVRVADDEASRSLGRVGMGVRLDAVPEWTRSRLEALIAQVRSQRGTKPSASGEALPAVPPAQAKPARRPSSADQPASAVWTPEELREAKLLEMDDQLQNARSRIDANAAHLSQLEQDAAEAKALSERVQREKNSLESELRSEAERLSAEVERLQRMLRRRWLLWTAILLPLVGAGAWTALSDSDFAAELRGWVWGAPSGGGQPGAMAPLALPEKADAGADAGSALPAVNDAGVDGGEPGEGPPDAGMETGTLRIDVDRGTHIWVDGKRVGKAPMKPIEVGAGSHRVRFDCRLEGRRVMSKPRYVQVLPNSEAAIEYICADGS